jgi:hypothetical protein
MRTLRIPLAVAILAAAVTGMLLMLSMSGSSSTAVGASSYAALDRPVSGPAATADRELQMLERERATLNLPSARIVLNDSGSTVYATRSTDGDLCLVERVTDPTSQVSSRFVCKDAELVARQGMIRGVYVEVKNNAFRLPGDTTSATVVPGAPVSLAE